MTLMDYQILFNVAATVVGVLGGWLLTMVFNAMERLDGDLRSLPQRYLAKDDYRNDLKRIEDMLERIFDKLDDKADK